jgi:hypothetical protein
VKMWFSGAIGSGCHVVLTTRSLNAKAKEWFQQSASDIASPLHFLPFLREGDFRFTCQ